MNNNKAKIYMIFSLLVLVITIIVSSTYAYYVWNTSDSEITKIAVGIGTATVTFDGGSDINANLRPVSDKSKGIVKTIKVKSDTAGLLFNMYLDITSIDTGLKDESFRYEFYRGTNKIKEGNFSDSYLTSNTDTCSKNSTKHIVLLTGESISTAYADYTLYIWIDGENYTNPNTMMNKKFSFKLHADGEGAVLGELPAYKTLKRLNALNSSIAIDTSKIPDFSTVSGNSGIEKNYDGNSTISTVQGDGTKGIYVSEDDFGTSYYFRGAVENNYVKFGTYSFDLYLGKDSNSMVVAGTNCNNIPNSCSKIASMGDDMYWRIIRINGDGSIRMIYTGTEAFANGSTGNVSFIGFSPYNINYNDNAYVGYMYGTVGSSSYEETHKNTNNSTIKKFVDNWYETYFNNYTDFLQDTIYCNDRNVDIMGDGTGTTSTAYSNFTRNWGNDSAVPSLKCTNINDRFTVSASNGNGALTYPVGLITTDETVLSGGKVFSIVNNSYVTNTNYYLFNGFWNWSMTPDIFADGSARVGNVSEFGYAGDVNTNNGDGAVRPVVSLRPDVIIGGDGTMNNPFVVE